MPNGDDTISAQDVAAGVTRALTPPPRKLILQTVSAERGAKPLGINDMVLYGVQPWTSNLSQKLDQSITSAEIEQTIEGASTITITVRDPWRKILRSDLVRYRSLMVVDDVRYRLVKVSRNGSELKLILENASVHVLRQFDQPWKADRSTMTRAQFVKRLIVEPPDVYIPHYIPELDIVQPIAPPKQEEAPPNGNGNGQGGGGGP